MFMFGIGLIVVGIFISLSPLPFSLESIMGVICSSAGVALALISHVMLVSRVEHIEKRLGIIPPTMKVKK